VTPHTLAATTQTQARDQRRPKSNERHARSSSHHAKSAVRRASRDADELTQSPPRHVPPDIPCLPASVSADSLLLGGGSGSGESFYLMGPDASGCWAPVTVLSIKHKESPVTGAEAGQSATFCLQVHIPQTKLRRGMVLIECASRAHQERIESPLASSLRSTPPPTPTSPPASPSAPPSTHPLAPPLMPSAPASPLLPAALPGAAVVWELEALVRAMRLPSPVPVGTEIVLHCVGVKQAARLLRVANTPTGGALEKLHEGDEARLWLRFVHAAEFVRMGSPCVLRDASSGPHHLGLAVGMITAVSAS